MPTGQMYFTLRTGGDALPLQSGSVTLRGEDGREVFSDELSPGDMGISGTATVETPPEKLSLERGGERPYSVFEARVRAEGFYRVKLTGIKAFERETTKVTLEMLPLPAGADSPESLPEIAVVLPGHVLFVGSEPPEKGTARDPAPGGTEPAIQVIEGVYVPETVTVHLGAPDSDAKNVTIPFVDYIKNVAASEIYPTWPEAAIRANVIAQVSIALNRVYTEWYRSRGYDFDITSSTAYDQAYTEGGNTYAETDGVVDAIFNNYLTRPNFVEPLFASFCDGRNTGCDGMSQWGTVELASDGRGVEEILGFYYGDVNVNETDDVRAIEGSYPGEPLREGDSGENVRIIQQMLNRIAINYPRLPLNNNFGVFDEQLTEVVKDFQEIFSLTVTGTVDKATWYKISFIYVSVKSLAELTSEGQRPSYNTQTYPGSPLVPSDKGSEVQEMQFYLRRISRFNPLVLPVNVDGIFDADTEATVKSFQSAYGLEPSGVIDERTWDAIVRVYNGTVENVDEPVLENGLSPYPGYDITFGSRGDQVDYIQRLLRTISTAFPIVPEVTPDGTYGAQTERAVDTFAAIFGFPRENRVSEALWNKINRIYAAVELGCIFGSFENEGRRSFPGEEIKKGSSVNDVKYVQERLRRIYRAIPYVGEPEADGIYGERTASGVGALQRVFGLTVTEKVNAATWDMLDLIASAVERGCLPLNFNAIPAYAPEGAPGGNSGVKALMRKKGLTPGPGPFFGRKSRRELAFWQAAHGLPPTGKVDEETLKRLRRD